MPTAQRGELPGPLVLRPPAWVRWLGPPLLIGLWLLMLSPVVLAVRERDWMAAVRDSGLGPLGAVVGWVIVGVLLLVIPPAVRAILTYRTVLDVDGVEPPFGRERVGLDDLEEVRWVAQGGPVNAANNPERIEVLAAGAGLVAPVPRSDPGWYAVLAMAREWARRRPEIIRDDRTAEVLARADT